MAAGPNWIYGLALGATGALSLIALAPHALARTVEAAGVQASYTQDPPSAGSPCVESPRLLIRRDGDEVYDEAIASELGICQQAERFEVLDLDQDSEPEVLIDFYSGGAHCCWFTQVYRYDGEQYQRQEQPWGNHNPTLEDIEGDGQPEFVGRDDRFAYQFASYADSAYPPQIWRYQGEAGFVDVTRQYPERIYDWAFGLWQRYERTRDQDGEVRPILAAYLASKYMLGQAEDGWQRVQTVYQQGDRLQFLAELATFLQQTGYAAPVDTSTDATAALTPAAGPATDPNLLMARQGSLEAGDNILPTDGSLYDEHEFMAQAGDVVLIRMESEAFDPYLFLVGPQGELLAQNDDATDSELAALLELTLPQTGPYRAIANSYDSTGRGSYRLTIRRQSQP